ncbi:MAG: hypothetical protein GX608_11130 [Lentisphaerae bacterium]|nr:hypothetical protein [Lentisphaerota bacterium]
MKAKIRAPSPRYPVLDAHNDSIILRQVRGDPMDFADVNPRYHVDLPRLRRGGISAIFVMVGEGHLQQSLQLIDAGHCMCAAHPKNFALCLTASDVRRANREDRIALIMSIEGQAMFSERLENLRNWQRLGVRVASLTHGGGNIGADNTFELQVDRSYFTYMAADERALVRRQSKGLTSFGSEALDEMARLGLVCDLAHANDNAFWEAIGHGKVKVCVTHGNCHALCPHMRNLTDEMLKALAARNGVIGICFFRFFIDREKPTLDRLADHFIHALEIMGPDHVGIGTDFDGLPSNVLPMIEDAAGLGALWEKLESRGVRPGVLKKIGMDNFLRLLD